jgi:hypothetical protein
MPRLGRKKKKGGDNVDIDLSGSDSDAGGLSDSEFDDEGAAADAGASDGADYPPPGKLFERHCFVRIQGKSKKFARRLISVSRDGWMTLADEDAGDVRAQPPEPLNLSCRVFFFC